KTAQRMAANGLVRLSFVKIDSQGCVDINDLERLLNTPDKTFVSLMHGNNEIANLLPLEKVSALCEKFNAVFHSDTVQTMGHYRFDVQATPIHFLNASAHKFRGPKGVGFIYVNKSVKANPEITGGGQE